MHAKAARARTPCKSPAGPPGLVALSFPGATTICRGGPAFMLLRTDGDAGRLGRCRGNRGRAHPVESVRHGLLCVHAHVCISPFACALVCVCVCVCALCVCVLCVCVCVLCV